MDEVRFIVNFQVNLQILSLEDLEEGVSTRLPHIFSYYVSSQPLFVLVIISVVARY